MTDKVQLIKEEIERQIEEWKVKCQQSQENNDHESLAAWSEHVATCGKLLVFINSLPEEPASEDLEEEIIRWHKGHFDNKRYWEKTSGEYLTRKSQLDLAHHFAEWQKNKDLEDSLKSDMTIPNKFYEKGRTDVMNEMMKDAISCNVDWYD